MKIFILLSLFFSHTFASNVYVIANEPITTSKKELQNFFIAKSDYLDGKKYKRISNKESLDTLANLALSMSTRKLSKKWIKQNFRKGTPFPVSLRNDVKTIEWIKTHPQTVGFITTKSDDVTIIYTFSE